MFLGTHEPKLDEKGRLILPARFRDELADGLVITKGQENCLYVFPASEFALITERLRQAPVTQKNSRDYLRVMFAGAHDEVPDNQGRITIPTALRTYATLEKNCVVIGANTRLEIWDAGGTTWIVLNPIKYLFRPPPLNKYSRRHFPGAAR
jgi:MraZ protein